VRVNRPSIQLMATLAIFTAMLFVTSTVAGQVLHSFTNNGTDGFEPYAGVVLDAFTGNLYGTTPGGGTYTYGTVYEVTP